MALNVMRAFRTTATGSPRATAGWHPADVPKRPRAATLRHLLLSFDERLVHTLGPMVIPMLRMLLGLVFVWFGALKLTDSSPVADLVAGTLPWADPHLVVPLLGAAEVALGLGLLTGTLLGVVLPLLAAHLAGTFLTFVMMPAQMYRDNDPLMLTADGEFVLKNLVLISATLVLIVHARSSTGHDPRASRS